MIATTKPAPGGVNSTEGAKTMTNEKHIDTMTDLQICAEIIDLGGAITLAESEGHGERAADVMGGRVEHLMAALRVSDDVQTCPECNCGEGRLKCPACGGAGFITDEVDIGSYNARRLSTELGDLIRCCVKDAAAGRTLDGLPRQAVLREQLAAIRAHVTDSITLEIAPDLEDHIPTWILALISELRELPVHIEAGRGCAIVDIGGQVKAWRNRIPYEVDAPMEAMMAHAYNPELNEGPPPRRAEAPVDDTRCEGCGCAPGDGATAGCTHPEGCGREPVLDDGRTEENPDADEGPAADSGAWSATRGAPEPGFEIEQIQLVLRRNAGFTLPNGDLTCVLLVIVDPDGQMEIFNHETGANVMHAEWYGTADSLDLDNPIRGLDVIQLERVLLQRAPGVTCEGTEFGGAK